MTDNGDISRLKDNERETCGRQKRKSNSGDAMKEGNKRRKLQEKQLVAGTIRFYVESTEDKTKLFNKMDRAKLCVSDRISSLSNFYVLDKALDYYLKNHSSATTDTLPVPAKQTRCHKPY